MGFGLGKGGRGGHIPTRVEQGRGSEWHTAPEKTKNNNKSNAHKKKPKKKQNARGNDERGQGPHALAALQLPAGRLLVVV